METKVCSCCGRELPITEFATRGIKGRKGEVCVTSLCKECMKEKVANGRSKKVDKAKSMRLKDFTPRELMERLRELGYTGKLNYVETHVIDLENL